MRLLPWGICGGFTLPGAHTGGRSQTGQGGQNSEFPKVVSKKQDYTEYSAEVQVQVR